MYGSSLTAELGLQSKIIRMQLENKNVLSRLSKEELEEFKSAIRIGVYHNFIDISALGNQAFKI